MERARAPVALRHAGAVLVCAHKRHLDTTFTQWHKSSYSNPNGNECVEVSFSNNAVGIRDSHHPHGAMLAVDHAEWTTFLDGISDGVAR